MKKFAIYDSPVKPEAVNCAEKAIIKLHSAGAELCCRPQLAERLPNEIRNYLKIYQPEEFEKFADAVISFGGDGTMLFIARIMLKTDIPIMGFNVGKLGFLAEFSVKELDKTIDDLMKGNYRVVDRTVLETSFQGETLYALNDFVIEKRHTSRMITIDCYTNKHYIGTFRSDGLIITTPTGSTAYSLSCGGPIIAPSTEVVCITPISPHSLTLRPLIIPSSNEISVRVHSFSGESHLVTDGNQNRILSNDKEIFIRRSEARVKLIKPLNSTYYDLLRTKLLWATNADDNVLKQ
ncbi:MAG: NAD(+)/NADH kinase [Bacteroidota bacterium]